MGIGNHELIILEEDCFPELAEDFIQQHEEEWEEFKQLMYGTDEERVETFCRNHEDWGDFLLEAYSNRSSEYLYEDR